MQFFSILLYLFTLSHSFLTSRSLIAPINIFIILIGFFFSSIFFNDHSSLVYVVYFSILVLVILHNLFTSGWVRPSVYITRTHAFKYPNTRFLICLSVIFLFLILFINKFGGLIGFIIASKRGTEEFYGLGHYKTIVGMVYPLGLISYVLHSYNINKRKLDYFTNFIIQSSVILIALLSLSRGTIINYFVSILLIRFLLGRKLSKLSYIIFPIAALIFASFYGVVRETLNFNDDNFSLGVENKDVKFKTEWMEFGTYPIEQIYLNHQQNTPSFGLTYITAITNLVPRKLWPSKPDPGGVVFTRDYTKGLYDEFNQYSTGVFPEAMINFGIVGGYFFGLIFFSFLLIGSTYVFYQYFLNRFLLKKKADVFLLVFYSYLFMSLPVLTTAEFTNVVTSLFLKIISLVLIYKTLFLKFKYEK